MTLRNCCLTYTLRLTTTLCTLKGSGPGQAPSAHSTISARPPTAIQPEGGQSLEKSLLASEAVLFQTNWQRCCSGLPKSRRGVGAAPD
eukprot:4546649-Pleurochrysis_carterae.AAC.1